MKQPALFPTERPLPYQHGSATSRAAAEAVAPRAQSQKRRILEAYALAGEYGATREEISHWQGIRQATVCPRVNELVRKGFLEPTGRERPTTSGQPAEVLQITQAGRRSKDNEPE